MGEGRHRGYSRFFYIKLLTMKIFSFSIIIAALSPVYAFAQGVETVQTQKQPAVEEIVIPAEEVEKALPRYSMNLKRLLEEAKRNITKVDEEILRRKLVERNRGREAEINEHFDRGNRLYEEGRLEEAKVEWQKTLEISKHPEMKEYIRRAEWFAQEQERKLQEARQEEELEKKLAERARQERLQKTEKMLAIIESKEALFDDAPVFDALTGEKR